jgi:hypothetical protein
MGWFYPDKASDISTRVIFPSHTPFENNLNHCAVEFMAGDFDFWLSVDSDNPPLRNPLDLAWLDLDVVGCPTPVWNWADDPAYHGDRPIYMNAYQDKQDGTGYREWPEQVGLQKVDAVGSGCIMFSRRVIEQFRNDVPFRRVTDDQGRVQRGPDIHFCERARNAGFEIWAHFDYCCDHYNELSLKDVRTAHDLMMRNLLRQRGVEP